MNSISWHPDFMNHEIIISWSIANSMNFQVFMGQIHENTMKFFIAFSKVSHGISYLGNLVK